MNLSSGLGAGRALLEVADKVREPVRVIDLVPLKQPAVRSGTEFQFRNGACASFARGKNRSCSRRQRGQNPCPCPHNISIFVEHDRTASDRCSADAAALMTAPG